MNFDIIVQLTQILDTSIFQFTFKGVKGLALAFLLLKTIDEFIKCLNSNTGFPAGTYLSYFGIALLIFTSDWIIDFGEEKLAMVDGVLNSLGKDVDVFTKITDEFEKQKLESATQGSIFQTFIDAVTFDVLDELGGMLMIMLGSVVAGFFKIADMVITLGYLIIRLFIIQLLKLLFPVALLFSVFDNTKSFFYGWIKRYVGTIVLGVAYIGIFWFTQKLIEVMLIPSSAHDVFPVSGLGFQAFLAMCVVYPIKFKLLQAVTSYVSSMFT